MYRAKLPRMPLNMEIDVDIFTVAKYEKDGEIYFDFQDTDGDKYLVKVSKTSFLTIWSHSTNETVLGLPCKYTAIFTYPNLKFEDVMKIVKDSGLTMTGKVKTVGKKVS